MPNHNRSSHQRDHTFRRTGWSNTDTVAFSARPEVRPRRRAPTSSNWGWWALSVLCLLGFALLVNAMLDRGQDTAGPSSAVIAPPPAAVDAATPNDDNAYPDTDTTPASAYASTPVVHKCIGAHGAVSYQSMPCNDTQATARIFAAKPDTNNDVAWSRYQLDKTHNDAAAMSRMAGTDGSRVAWSSNAGDTDVRRMRCNSAKASRAATLEHVGLRRTYDLLQSLDAMVRDACRGLDP